MAKLIDSFGRSIDYVRVSVTDRCDLRCGYCMPKQFHDFHEPEEWLTFEEIERVMAAFARLGTRRIRLTGGEPLVRKDLPQLAQRLSALPGIEDLSLSTNATRMDKHAADLHAAGISRLNISLDSLHADTFKQITGGKLEKVLNGIMAAKAAGFRPIKINMVLMKGVNDHEVEDMVNFCIQHSLTLRFIETMPVGDSGRAATEHYIDLGDIRKKLEQRFELIPGVMPGGGPARYLKVAGTNINIGFITPISQHFCATCNRVRLSVDGTLYTCLGQEHHMALRPLLRAGIDDKELELAIINAIHLKPERHEFKEKPEQILRFMSYTGG
ncbi:MAG: GTP 3',8-cyclase MoaA [Gammaproteobacteria bacterium]|jgi:GTP 3',8-cyclase|nr:GTP 3',8-cyclase MoaA [Gammaproteobacteria bacterium]